MMTEDFTKDVLSQIKDKKIEPCPRWRFALGNYLLWFLVAVATILGALAVTTIIYILTDYDWDIFRYLDPGPLFHIFVAMPYLWLVSLVLLLATIFYNLRHTKCGYRYEAYKIIGLSVAVSLLLGVILFFCGLDSEIHECFMKRVPMYGRLVPTNRDLWVYPELGLVAGNIKLFNGDQGFILQDLNGAIWMVATDTQTVWDDRISPATNTVIKVIGVRQDNKNFKAKNIRPWNKPPPRRPMKQFPN